MNTLQKFLEYFKARVPNGRVNMEHPEAILFKFIFSEIDDLKQLIKGEPK